MSAICDAHKKKVVVEQLHNSVHMKFNQLEIRCLRESQIDPRLSSCSWREDGGMRNMSQRGWDPRPPVEQPRRTGKKHCYGRKSGGSVCSNSVQSPNSLSHTTISIKWEADFSKELCRSSLLCWICICIWVYNTIMREVMFCWLRNYY